MNANDGHEMLVARCEALKHLAVDGILHALYVAGVPCTDKEAEVHLEAEVEKLAPGCSHPVR